MIKMSSDYCSLELVSTRGAAIGLSVKKDTTIQMNLCLPPLKMSRPQWITATSYLEVSQSLDVFISHQIESEDSRLLWFTSDDVKHSEIVLSPYYVRSTGQGE